MVGKSRVSVLLLAVAAILGGCGGPAEPSPSVSESPSVPSPEGPTASVPEPGADLTSADPDADCDAEDLLCIQVAQLPGVAESLGLSEVPSDVPAPVRLVTQQEQTELVVGCLREAGFDVEVDGTSYGIELTTEQAEVYRVTQFTCLAQYPLLPQFTGPLSQVQLERVYEYFRDELIPCLVEEGLVVEGLPSLETFMSQAESGTLFSPFADPSIMALGQGEWERLEKVCPQMPSDDVLFAP